MTEDRICELQYLLTEFMQSETKMMKKLFSFIF